MTNGEKIKEIFPDAEISIVKSKHEHTKVAVDWKFEQIPSYYNLFYEDWWNAEYKEPTTKNNLEMEKTDMIDKSDFSQEQYKADLQSAYDCGYERAKNDLGVDCVSRILVQSAISKSIEYKENPYQLYKRIDRLPSVTPQSRKGHWISTYGNVKCSVCGSVKDSREVGKATYYCDFCGAKMESKEV